ncbi:MAG: Ca2+-dependent phosphoinositide-specific phospholipase C [Ilumatobacteraceae bacterium]
MGALSAVLLVVVAAGASVAHGASSGVAVRLNDLQVVGTHNSYHVEPAPELLHLMMSVDPTLIDVAVTHPPLAIQLSDEAVRQVELDVFADPDGTLWRPIGTPGFKVFHMEQVDMGSTCETFVACLRALKGWSDAHPSHLPIFVLVQPEDELVLPGPPNPVPVTTAVLDSLDAEVRSVMKPGDLITPDRVRGKHPSVEAAVLADAWPTLADARGKFVFLLDDFRDQYVVGHPNLEGRVMFPASTPGQPDAAFVEFPDPRLATEATIRDLVRKGYLVRTRADEAVVTPQSGDTTQREAAFTSGAQIVSTDYPIPGSATRWGGSTYVVQLPGGVIARCNPVRAPQACRTRDLTEPRTAKQPTNQHS